MATIISNPGGSLLIHFFWIEDALAHNLDIPLLRIDLPKQAAPIAFVTGRTPDLVNLNQDLVGITVTNRSTWLPEHARSLRPYASAAGDCG